LEAGVAGTLYLKTAIQPPSLRSPRLTMLGVLLGFMTLTAALVVEARRMPAASRDRSDVCGDGETAASGNHP
jgi:hypothetical protein